MTSLGEQQAAKLAEHLRNAGIEQIFASELRRTQQTAQLVNKYHGAPMDIDARLNDNKTGYDGQPAALWYAAIDEANNKETVRFNDGESLQEIRERAANFVNDLSKLKHGVVLVVTSKIIVQAIYDLVYQIPSENAWQLPVDTASFIEINL